jgi:hypothetical protein
VSSDIVRRSAQEPAPLQPAEREVYRKHIYDRARVQAATWLQREAEELRGQQHTHTRDQIHATVRDDLQVIRGIRDKQEREFMEVVENALLDDLVKDVRGYQRTTALKVDGILAEEYPEAPEVIERPASPWRALLGWI